jgi:polyhydroxyalkanoate synthesis repressor PhaR
MSGWDIRVIDATNNADITRSILLQIILDEETSGSPLFSAKMLSQLIRFYGGTVQGVFVRYLEETLDLFASQQGVIQEEPFKIMARMAQQNAQLWAEMQQMVLNATGFGTNNHKND